MNLSQSPPCGPDRQDAEWWELFDQNRRPLNRTHPRGRPLPEGAFHVVSEVWVADLQNRLLLTLRAPQKEISPGLWEATAGSVLAGESSREGAVRELREETGLAADPAALHLIGVVQTAGVFVDVYVLRLDVQHVTLQPGETEDFRMVTLSELDDMGRRGLLAPHILRHLSLFEEQLRFFLEPSLSPGLYRHYKGNVYELVCMARHSETLEPMVIYRPADGTGGAWARPAVMWFDAVPQGGSFVRRFSKLARHRPAF